MISVRPATEQDASAISHIHVQTWLTTYAGIVPQDYLSSLNEAERVPVWRQWLVQDIQAYVAELDGEVVGFACGGQIRETLREYDAELFAIYVLKRAQGFGIGTALLGSLAASLTARGFTSMVAWCLQDNPSAGFYGKTGALRVSSKTIEIGGALLPEVAFAWPNLKMLAASR
jgi:L-amino acid N-acyltransferase YncA